jgi:hypothetical protein
VANDKGKRLWHKYSVDMAKKGARSVRNVPLLFSKDMATCCFDIHLLKEPEEIHLPTSSANGKNRWKSKINNPETENTGYNVFTCTENWPIVGTGH